MIVINVALIDLRHVVNDRDNAIFFCLSFLMCIRLHSFLWVQYDFCCCKFELTIFSRFGAQTLPFSSFMCVQEGT